MIKLLPLILWGLLLSCGSAIKTLFNPERWIAFLLSFTFFSCATPKKNLFNGHYKFTEFPREVALQAELFPGTSGGSSIQIIDNYLVTESDNSSWYIKCYELDSQKLAGEFVEQHEDYLENDFMLFRIAGAASPYLYIQDSYLNKLWVVDFYHLLAGEPNASVAIDYSEIDNPYNAFHLSDKQLYIKSFNENKGFIYSTFDREKKTMSDPLVLYNQSFGYLELLYHFADCIKPDRSKIVNNLSILDQLNIIDIVNPERSFSIVKTESPPAKLPKLSYLSKEKQEGVLDPLVLGQTGTYFGEPVCNDQFIAALYYRIKEGNQEIHLFDWEGNGVCKFTIDEIIGSFTIDWQNGYIYAVSFEGNEIYKYPLTR